MELVLLRGHMRKSDEGCRERFSTQKKGETCGKGPARPSSFGILLHKNMMFRPIAANCGHDGEKRIREKMIQLEY